MPECPRPAPFLISGPEDPLAVGDLICERSWRPGAQHFTRLDAGSPLQFRVTVRGDGPRPDSVIVHAQTQQGNRLWNEMVPLQPAEERVFHGGFCPSHPGILRFRAKYRENGRWFRDGAPFAHVKIDDPRKRELRIYTLIPAVSGTIPQWTRHLTHIQDLGFNTVQLLPLTVRDRSGSPYAAVDLFQLDPAWCDPGNGRAQLDQFVHELQNRNMHLCVDLVVNHVGISCPMIHANPSWVQEDENEPDGIKRAGWFDGTTWQTWRDIALLNYEPGWPEARETLWNTMTRYARFWGQFAQATRGLVRLDNLHSSYEPFMLHLLAELRHSAPDILLLGELFAPEEEIERLVLRYDLDLLLATPWEHPFVPQLRTYLTYLHRKARKLQYFFPAVSHDSGSMVEEFGHLDATIPRLALSFLLGPGPAGMVQGVECGIQKHLGFIGHQPPLQWSDQPFGHVLRKLHRLATSPSFCVPGNLTFVDHDHDAVLAAVRCDPGSGHPSHLVAVNMDYLHSQSIHIPRKALGNAQHDSPVPDLMQPRSFTPAHDTLELNLEPADVIVLDLKP